MTRQRRKKCNRPEPPSTNIINLMNKVSSAITINQSYIKDLRHIFCEMEIDRFLHIFISVIKKVISEDAHLEGANRIMLFCAKFTASEDMRDFILNDVLDYLLHVTSYETYVQCRICQLINMILKGLGPEAILGDDICDSILAYMMSCITDVSPSVRTEAIMAMQRLQAPENPDDPVIRCYQFHLCSDPSARVRQTIISCIGRSHRTFPYILDRVRDVDDRVRRQAYLNLSIFPVKSLKISERLIILENGLNDRCGAVLKAVSNVLLKQWVDAYNKNYMALITALKLYADEEELIRFRKITAQTLQCIFESQNHEDIVSCLALETDETHFRCIPLDKLTLEQCLYWLYTMKYFRRKNAQELEAIVPELNVFCKYLEDYIKSKNSDMDTLQLIEYQYIVINLIDILQLYNFDDEMGRKSALRIIGCISRDLSVNLEGIEKLVQCTRSIIRNTPDFHGFFVEIIKDICGLNSVCKDLLNIRNCVNELLANSTDAVLNLKLSELKAKFLELEELEMNSIESKDYIKVQQIVEQTNEANEEFVQLHKQLLKNGCPALVHPVQLPIPKVTKNELILRGLQITFRMIASTPLKRSIGQTTYLLFKNFVSRYIAYNEINIRRWALQCGAAFSILHEPIAKRMYGELYSQFFRNHSTKIWEISIICIMELFDYYGIEKFINHCSENTEEINKGTRQLYNMLEFMDCREANQIQAKNEFAENMDAIQLMLHFFDTCEDIVVMEAIVKGFCQLILHNRINNPEIMEKLLLQFFSESTEPKITQILGVFFQQIIRKPNKEVLFSSLVNAVTTVFNAPFDSALHNISPGSLSRFIIDATYKECNPSNLLHSHMKLAEMFMEGILNNITNRKVSTFLSRELLKLNVFRIQNKRAYDDLTSFADKLLKRKLDQKISSNILQFKSILAGETKVEENDSENGTIPASISRAKNKEYFENDSHLMKIDEEDNHEDLISNSTGWNHDEHGESSGHLLNTSVATCSSLSKEKCDLRIRRCVVKISKRINPHLLKNIQENKRMENIGKRLKSPLRSFAECPTSSRLLKRCYLRKSSTNIECNKPKADKEDYREPRRVTRSCSGRLYVEDKNSVSTASKSYSKVYGVAIYSPHILRKRDRNN